MKITPAIIHQFVLLIGSGAAFFSLVEVGETFCDCTNDPWIAVLSAVLAVLTSTRAASILSIAATCVSEVPATFIAIALYS